MINLVIFVVLILIVSAKIKLDQLEYSAKTIKQRVNIAFAMGLPMPNDICHHIVHISTQALYDYFYSHDDFNYIMRVADGMHVIIDFDKLQHIHQLLKLKTA